MEGSGIEYPKIALDGKVCTVKFSRAAFYRLDKAGFDLRTLPSEVAAWFPRDENGITVPGFVRPSVVIDLLHAAVGDQLRCSAEQLAEFVGDRLGEAAAAVVEAMGKIAPSAETLAAPAAPERTVQ